MLKLNTILKIQIRYLKKMFKVNIFALNTALLIGAGLKNKINVY